MNDAAREALVMLHRWMAHLLGAGVRQPVLGALTWADLDLSGAVVLLALIVTVVMALLIRRGRGPVSRVLGVIGGPLYLLIWTLAGYLILASALSALQAPRSGAVGLAVLGRILGVGLFAVLLWSCTRVTHVLEAQLQAWTQGAQGPLAELFAPTLGRSVRVILPVIAVIFALPLLGLPAAYATVVTKGTGVLLIIALNVAMIHAVDAAEKALLQRFDRNVEGSLKARKLYTQVHVIGRVINVGIGLFAVACILMLFQQVRHVGTSLLASAGIVGVIAGVAGQKALGNLIAGFQIALSQPIRQDDVVIVEGEWGRIEEITLSYVVVRIWDDRRLVLPLTYFIEKPFQNWTRNSTELTGVVFLWVDYSFPIEEGRKALKSIIEGSAKWDGRAWNLQVTDTSERSMQLRVLASAADSSNAFDLRCEIREKFIAYIQQHHPASLPSVRAQLLTPAVTARVRDTAA